MYVWIWRRLPGPTAVKWLQALGLFLAVVDGTVPAALEVTARTEGGVIMGLRHREHAVEGVQFHPESVLTQGGHRMLANWLRTCGDAQAVDRVPPLEADVERLRLSAV